MVEVINAVTVWMVPTNGPLLGSGESALDLIGDSHGQGIDLMAVPAARLDPEFFRLASGLAGEFIQKLQNYGFRVALVGDVADYVARSAPLADFVRETNRRAHHLFVADVGELRTRLGKS